MVKLYERSVAELMVEAAAQAEYPTSRADLVAWFVEHYPQVKASTVRAHITGLTANDRNRHHYAWLAKREPLFTRNPDGTLSPFDAQAIDEIDEMESDAEEAAAPRLEFALESFLEQFLLTNWEGIDWGRPLEIWESETGKLGHQLPTPVGRLDFLCRDTATNALVVIELKRGRPSDRVVGQAARYMGLGTSAPGPRDPAGRGDHRRPRAGAPAGLRGVGCTQPFGAHLQRRLHAVGAPTARRSRARRRPPGHGGRLTRLVTPGVGPRDLASLTKSDCLRTSQ